MPMSSVSSASRVLGSRLGGLLVAVCFGAAFAAVAGATTLTWNNPAGGAWSDPANWTPNEVPDVAGEVAVLPALSGAYQVTLDIDPGIDALQIGAADPTLDLHGHSIAAVPSVSNAGKIVNFVGLYDSGKIHNLSTGTVVAAFNKSFQSVGPLVNDGRIIVGPGAASMVYAPSGLSVGGTGTLILDHSQIYDPSGALGVVIQPGATLSGSGVVNIPITNYGVIEGDGTRGPLLRVDGIIWNYGTLRVSHDGGINVNRPLLKNLGGTITSGPGGGTFSVMTVNQIGGTMDCGQGGRLVADGGDLRLSCGTLMDAEIQRVGPSGAVSIDIATIQNVTVATGAELSVPGHADLMAAGTSLTNNGTVRVSGSINFGILDGQYSINLAGTGTLILEGGTLGSGTGATLWNKSGQTIQGCGTINPPFLNDGTVSLDCGAQLGAVPGSFVNRKVMRVTGGKLVVSGASTKLTNRGTLSATTGAISVENGGTIDNTGGVLSAAGGNIDLGTATTAGTVIGGKLESSGGAIFRVQKAATLRDVTLGPTATLLTMGGATTTATGTRFLNQGTNRVASLGTFAVGATTDYVQTSGATALEGGAISSTRDLQIQAGALRGIGTVTANVVNAGDLSPDANAAPLRVQGDYRQTSTGSFRVALAAGLSSQLDVTGSATLDGALATSVADGYLPAPGNSFSVLSYGSLAGKFVQSASGLEAASQLDVLPVYGPSALALVVSSALSVGGPAAAPATLRFYGRRGANGSSFVLELPQAADLKGRIYDASGREVARFADGPRPAGVHVFPLRDAGGASGGLASGMYFARVVVSHGAGGDVRTARVIVLR